MSDTVNHPSYYNYATTEVIDLIEDFGLNFHLGQVLKYILRAGRKSSKTEVEDLRKALWYLERYIDLRRFESPKPKTLAPGKSSLARDRVKKSGRDTKLRGHSGKRTSRKQKS